MAALFLRLFLIGELNIVAKLIQNLYEGLSQDHHFKWWFENSPKRAVYIAAYRRVLQVILAFAA